jgi:cytoskeletal protein RodZ
MSLKHRKEGINVRYLKIISLFLAMVMIVSAFAACGNNENQTDSSENEMTSTEMSSPENSGGESDSEGTSNELTTSENVDSEETGAPGTANEGNSTEETSTDGTSEIESSFDESTELETMGPSTPAEVSDWIKDANALANGVSAHYTDGSRKDYLINNKNMTMHLGLGGDGYNAVQSITNKNGGTYIQNTMDIYTIVNGQKYTFTNSPVKARANIYRLG